MKQLLTKTLFILSLLSAAIPSVMQANNDNLSKTNFNLEESVKSNDIVKIKQAIKSGTNVNLPFCDYFTPLIYAAGNGCLEVVELLLANGAEVNLQNNYGGTALMNAADRGHLETVKLLLANGAHVNQRSYDGGTTLMCAALMGNLEVVKLLLANGAHVNPKDQDYTPLMLAANTDSLEIVELLLANGADVNRKNNDGWTALKFAKRRGYLEIAELLLTYKANH